ncbi:MAG: TlpA disulfide reductase family protein [Myxococcaceae bacterium]
MARGQMLLALASLLLTAGCEYYEKPFKPIPDSFEITTLDGTVLRRSDLLGKPWVINIWVPGCSICVREFPGLEAVRREYEPKGVGFLAVSIEPDEALVRAAAAKIGLGQTVAISENETLGPLSVNQVPSTVFVNAEGVIVAAASGERDRNFLAKRTRALLGE